MGRYSRHQPWKFAWTTRGGSSETLIETSLQQLARCEGGLGARCANGGRDVDGKRWEWGTWLGTWQKVGLGVRRKAWPIAHATCCDSSIHPSCLPSTLASCLACAAADCGPFCSCFARPPSFLPYTPPLPPTTPALSENLFFSSLHSLLSRSF